MIRDDKQRVIGKLVSINSEKFTVELLNQSINFTTVGFEDIYQYAQINGYVILPYQDFYIVAEIFGVREKDADIRWKGEKEQILSKSNSVKYLDINPIGTIQKGKFKYGISVFPTLYTDVLYIKKEELDVIFDLNEELIQDENSENTKLKLLDIGTSTIFPDYKVKIDINGFFGGHSSVLGNTGSGKSCTIASMIQTLFKKEQFSAIGASFIFFDVNGEYLKAFSQVANPEIDVKYFSINGVRKKEDFDFENIEIKDNVEFCEFKLPHWFLTIDEWALLLHASEKTQLPILRKALGIASIISNNEEGEEYKRQLNYILSTAIGQILRSDLGSPSKRDRIVAILNRYKTEEIVLTKKFTYFDNDGNSHTKISSDDNRVVLDCSIENCLVVHFGGLLAQNALLQYIEQTDADGNFKFMHPSIKIPDFIEDSHFTIDILEDALDLAILHEEAYGNRQIRDYCSSLITRFKSLKERRDFGFLIGNDDSLTKQDYINDVIGSNVDNSKKTQVSIIDLNAIEDEVVEVISCVISRLVFEKLKLIEPRNSFPVNLILEEAHRYISERKTSAFGEANKIFEKIAKEGRKYGMFLLVSSQRPSELSKTVLSQCSNFIIHRIQNPDDLAQIRQMTPHISGNIMGRLPSIPRQHALVFGHSVQIPTLFKVNGAKPTPHSNDSDIVKHWFKAKVTPLEDNSEFVDDFNDIL
jgi:hypothetical protein